MLIVYLFLIIGFSFLLIKATDILIINFRSLAKRTRVGQFAISGLILALATSLPEFFVGVTAALEGSPSLSLGNVIGSNIADLSLVMGGAALVGGAIQVRGVFLRKDVFYAFLGGAAPMILLFDKNLSQIDGLILLALYGFYQVIVFGEQKKRITSSDEKGFIHQLLRRLNHKEVGKEFGWIFLGIALLLFSAEMLVRAAKEVALILNVPILMIGLFLIAVGTSLPELIFEIKAVKNRQPEMAFGNLLGSVVANGTLIIGITALISPIKIQAFEEYLLATLAFVMIFGVFYLFIRTKHRLDRWEGAALLGFYLAFVLAEFIHL